MNSTKHPLAATAKAAGVAAALILGLTLSAGGAAAHARTAGPDATPVTSQTEVDCDKDQAAVDATLDTAEKQLQSAFRTNHLAIEQLREKAGERNNAARDLLKQADSQLKAIRATAKTALDAAGESAESCTALDSAAIDAIVVQATADMEAVVTEVTATVAALPAPDKKANDEDNDEDNDETSDVDHETKSAHHDETKSAHHDTKSVEKSSDKSGEKSTVKATTTSKGHSKP